MAQPIQLHYWPTPNGHKVTIALEEMGLPYEINTVNIGKGDQFRPEFLAISPNNRMPAIVDPDGPGGQPVSVFESGAILQYLGRKTGLFYGPDERDRIAADQWLFWQMAGLGPMAGQAHHFRLYAPAMVADQRQLAYGVARYTNEVHRLYGVLNKQLQGRDFITGAWSIADMAAWPWTLPFANQGVDIDEFPDLKAWQARIAARPAVQAAMAQGDRIKRIPLQSAAAEEERRLLFGQRAR